MAKRVVHVPQRVAPLLTAAIGMATTPPSGIPIQPIGAYRERIQQVIVDEAHHVVDACDVIVVIRIGHVLTGHKVHKRHPIGIVSVLYPRAAPRFDEVHKVTRLVVVLRGKIKVIHLFTVLVNAPVFAIEVDDAAFVGSFVDVQIRQMAERLHVGIPDVSTTGAWVIVVRRSFEDQTLVYVALLHVEERLQQAVAVAHLIACDVVKSLLWVGIRVIAVLVGVA